MFLFFFLFCSQALSTTQELKGHLARTWELIMTCRWPLRSACPEAVLDFDVARFKGGNPTLVGPPRTRRPVLLRWPGQQPPYSLTILSCLERKEHTEGLAAVQSVAADRCELLRSPWGLWGRLTSRQVTPGRARLHLPTLCLIWTKKGPRLWLIKVLLSKQPLCVWIIFLNKANLEIA